MSWPCMAELWAERAERPEPVADLAAPSPPSPCSRTVTLIVCGLFAMPSRSRYFFATETVAV